MRRLLLACAVVVLLIASVATVAQTAGASFRLEYAPGVEHGDGIGSSRITSAPTFLEPKPVGAPRVELAATPPASGDAFWRELQKCETPHGDDNPLYVGPFQFHPDTAARAGGTDLAAAKRWAKRLADEGTSPGSTAGWPVCWWKAKAAAGYAPH